MADWFEANAPTPATTDWFIEHAPSPGLLSRAGNTVSDIAQRITGSRVGSTALDVVKGIGKGAATELTGPAEFLGPMLERLTARTFGRPAIPTTVDLSTLEAKNPAQMVGKGAEFVGSFLTPGILSRAKTALTAAEQAKRLPAVLERITSKAAPLKKAAPIFERTLEGPRLPTALEAEAAGIPPQEVLDLVKKLKTPGLNRPARMAVETAIRKRGGVVPLAEIADAPQVTKVLKAGKLPEAATQIEQITKQSVEEIAQDLRRYYGAEKAGEQLGKTSAEIRTLAPGPARKPLMLDADALDRRFAHLIMSEKGGVSPTLLKAGAGGVAGAVVGGTQGETDEERIQHALIGGVLGAAVVPFVAHALASGAPKKAMQDLVYTSVLSSPSSVIKAYLGGIGGAIGLATEKLGSGQIRSGSIILKELIKEQPSIISALRRPGVASSAIGEKAPTYIGRIFDAVNEPAVRAMMRAGVSREDAIRATLSGAPTTRIGQKILSIWNDSFGLRLISSFFPRVGIQILERGLERTPLGLAQKSLQTAGTKGEQIARAVQGPAAGFLAAQYGDQIPDWLKPYAVALSGVYALPVGVGLAANKARQRGSSPITAGIEEFTSNLPFPVHGPQEAATQVLSGELLVPNLLRDIARTRDPYERDVSVKKGGYFARAKAKIPGLRETLPTKSRPVNIAGEPIQDRSSAVTRFFSSAQMKGGPLKGIPPAVQQELSRLEISINPPSGKATIGKKTIDVAPDLVDQYRAQSRSRLIPRIERLMASPAYQNDTDEGKRRRLKSAVGKAEIAGRTQARSTLRRLLKERTP